MFCKPTRRGVFILFFVSGSENSVCACMEAVKAESLSSSPLAVIKTEPLIYLPTDTATVMGIEMKSCATRNEPVVMLPWQTVQHEIWELIGMAICSRIKRQKERLPLRAHAVIPCCLGDLIFPDGKLLLEAHQLSAHPLARFLRKDFERGSYALISLPLHFVYKREKKQVTATFNVCMFNQNDVLQWPSEFIK